MFSSPAPCLPPDDMGSSTLTATHCPTSACIPLKVLMSHRLSPGAPCSLGARSRHGHTPTAGPRQLRWRWEASLSDATARGTAVNYGGVAVGGGGEAVPCWALDDFGLKDVSLLKIDAVRRRHPDCCGARIGSQAGLYQRLRRKRAHMSHSTCAWLTQLAYDAGVKFGSTRLMGQQPVMLCCAGRRRAAGGVRRAAYNPQQPAGGRF